MLDHSVDWGIVGHQGVCVGAHECARVVHRSEMKTEPLLDVMSIEEQPRHRRKGVYATGITSGYLVEWSTKTKNHLAPSEEGR